MQRMKTTLALLSMLYAFGSLVCAQTASGNDNAKVASGVAITIAPAESAAQASHSLTVNVTVTNNTNRVLVETFTAESGPFTFEIHNKDGVVPAETDLGCKRHMSTKCGPSVKLGGFISIADIVVLPGQSKVINYDLGREYKVDTETTLVIDAVDNDFVLVDVPSSVMQYPKERLEFELRTYERYSYTKLDTIRSNTITVQVAH
jgi:hypothetical protein